MTSWKKYVICRRIHAVNECGVSFHPNAVKQYLTVYPKQTKLRFLAEFSFIYFIFALFHLSLSLQEKLGVCLCF